MSQYEIVPLLNGEFINQEKSKFTYGSNFGVKFRAPILAYLVRGGGRSILVDTGGADGEWCRQHHSEVHQTEEMTILNALGRHGLSPADLDCVVNTHLHYDHCFGNPLFRGRKIYVQQKEIDFAENPVPSFLHTYEHERAGFFPKWKVNREDLVAVDGDVEIAPGVRLVLLPGHSLGFQGVLVDTKAGNCLIAGDFIPLLENWLGNAKNRRVITGMCVSMIDAYKSFEKIEGLCVGDRILAGHDPLVLEHETYPY